MTSLTDALTDSTSDVPANANYGRLLNVILILLLGAVGLWLAPADLAVGAYTADIEVTLPDGQLTVPFSFTLGRQDGQKLVVAAGNGPYSVEVEGHRAYPYQLGTQISYRLRLLDAGGDVLPLALEDASSTIRGPQYSQTLPPSQADEDGWLTFAMRVPFKAKTTLALLFIVAGLWLTELVPLSATALLIPIVVVVAGLTDAATILQPFAHPIIMLFLAGFLLAEGMKRTGVDRRLALMVLQRASLKPAYLMLTMMAITAFLSMWMSNTASVAILIPIALAILDKIPEELGRTGFRRALILGVAYAGAVGGVGSAIGTPANILAMTFLNDFADADLAFIDWFAYGLPVVAVMVPLIWLYLMLTFRVQTRGLTSAFSHEPYARELREMGSLSRPQLVVLLVFVGVIGLWLTEQWHGIPTAIVALAGAFVLFFSGAIESQSLNQINWNALLTFGGGLAIGTILVMSGVSDWVALQLIGLAALPPQLVVLLVAGLTLLVGAFISNTACAAMLIPMSIPLAQILQLDPRLLVAVVAIASSIDFALVIGTPPTMIAYSTGIFTTREIFRRGVLLDILGILVLSLGAVWLWQLLGVVTLR